MRAWWILSMVVLAGCAGPSAESPDVGPLAPAPQPLAVEEWTALLSEPVYDGIVETIHSLQAEDGTHLALTLYLPEGLPADVQVPTVLELTPYQSLDRGIATAVSPLSGSIEPGPGWTEQVLRGMAFVRADARGTHGSAGCLDFGGEADRSDARVFMQWIRDQPWSDGRIVTDGVSHPGMGSLVAHVADPGLSAAIATSAVASYYMDEYFQGAHYDNQFNGPAYQAIELAPGTSTRPDDLAAQAAPCTGQTTLDYDLLDGTWGPLWQERDLALTLENALAAGVEYTAPILLNQGFNDVAVQPDHTQMYWDALPQDYPKSMILGYWGHGNPDMDGHPATYADWRQRYFDHHLLGIDNGMQLEPRVLVEDSQGTWHESHDWPIDGSNETTWYPVGDALAQDAPAAATLRYADPLPHDQDRAEARLLFRSTPLDRDTLVNGQPRVELVATSDQDETKWVVFLYDEAPDGTRQHISHGMSDSHRLHARDEGWAGIDGVQTWQMDLLPTAQVVEAGHSIVMEITSQWSNQVRQQSICFDDHSGGQYCPIGIMPSRTAGQATNTVHIGPEGTRLHLDLVDPAVTEKP